MSPAHAPMSPPGRHIYTLDELLALRAEARRGRSFRVMLGAERFQDMASYEEGYAWCCDENGFRDHEHGAFTEWLRDVRGELPEGWRDHYVEVCGGDHERAMMRLLDLVAEFRESRGHESPSLDDSSSSPPLPPEHPVSILDVMTRAHAQARRGYPLWLSYGTRTLPAMATHIRGYLRCSERNGFPDTRWHAFRRWLTDTRGLHPDTCVPWLLQHYGGDHEKAMMRLLELATEYVHEHEGSSTR
jgi:hypothetical protein